MVPQVFIRLTSLASSFRVLGRVTRERKWTSGSAKLQVINSTWWNTMRLNILLSIPLIQNVMFISCTYNYRPLHRSLFIYTQWQREHLTVVLFEGQLVKHLVQYCLNTRFTWAVSKKGNIAKYDEPHYLKHETILIKHKLAWKKEFHIKINTTKEPSDLSIEMPHCCIHGLHHAVLTGSTVSQLRVCFFCGSLSQSPDEALGNSSAWKRQTTVR